MGRAIKRAEEIIKTFDLQIIAFKNEVLSGIRGDKFNVNVFDYTDPGPTFLLQADYNFADQKVKNSLIERYDKLTDIFTNIHSLLLEYRETVGEENVIFSDMAKKLLIMIKFLSWLAYIK